MLARFMQGAAADADALTVRTMRRADQFLFAPHRSPIRLQSELVHPDGLKLGQVALQRLAGAAGVRLARRKAEIVRCVSGNPQTGRSMTGLLYRQWTGLRGQVGAKDVVTVPAACERGKKSCVAIVSIDAVKTALRQCARHRSEVDSLRRPQLRLGHAYAFKREGRGCYDALCRLYRYAEPVSTISGRN